MIEAPDPEPTLAIALALMKLDMFRKRRAHSQAHMPVLRLEVIQPVRQCHQQRAISRGYESAHSHWHGPSLQRAGGWHPSQKLRGMLAVDPPERLLLG